MTTSPRKPALHFIAILILAFTLCLWDLNARALWFDEAYEYWSAVVPLRQILETAATSFQPPLYSYLLHVWMLLGVGPVWIRFLSVAFAVLSVAAMLHVGAGWLGQRGAVVAGLVMAVLPTFVKYAQEAAEYALLGFLLTWLLLALQRTYRQASWGAWTVWGVVSVLAVYTHYGAALPVITLGVLRFGENARQRHWAALGKQTTVAICGVMTGAPLLGLWRHQLSVQRNVVITPFLGPLSEVRNLLLASADTFHFQLTGWPFTRLPEWPGATAVYLILSMSLALLVQPDRNLRLIAVSFWSTTLVYFVVVRLGWYAYGTFGFRYALILAPLFVLLIAAVYTGLSRLNPAGRLAGLAIVLIVAGMTLYSLPNRTFSERTRGQTAWPETEDMDGVFAFWAANRQPGDSTYVYYGAAPAFRYYMRLTGIEPPTQLPATWYSACWQAAPVDYCVKDGIYFGAWTRGMTTDELQVSIRQTLPAMPPRLWLILSHIVPEEDRNLLTALQTDYQIARELQANNAAAYLLIVKPDGLTGLPGDAPLGDKLVGVHGRRLAGLESSCGLSVRFFTTRKNCSGGFHTAGAARIISKLPFNRTQSRRQMCGRKPHLRRRGWPRRRSSVT